LLAQSPRDDDAWEEHSQACAMVLLELHASVQGGVMERCSRMIQDFATAQGNLDDDESYLNYSTLTGDHGGNHLHFLKIPELQKMIPMQGMVK
jgi:hypothetical protein